MLTPAAVSAFLAAPPVLVAELTRVQGSSPRDQGTFMLIGPERTLGTIGGGALEYIVIDRARRVLRDGLAEDTVDIPLGPEIGQCCGGRVGVSLHLVDGGRAGELERRTRAEWNGRPSAYVFGGGHVGRALAAALALLPFRTEVLDTRPEELEGFPPGVATRAVAVPEAVVRQAPAGSAFAILTHDHALDFLIAAEALARTDSAYVGMVGSRTKRARFASWYRETGGDARELLRLQCPIGADGLGDKRPEVIAALAAAEITVALVRHGGHAAAPVPLAMRSGHGR